MTMEWKSPLYYTQIIITLVLILANQILSDSLRPLKNQNGPEDAMSKLHSSKSERSSAVPSAVPTSSPSEPVKSASLVTALLRGEGLGFSNLTFIIILATMIITAVACCGCAMICRRHKRDQDEKIGKMESVLKDLDDMKAKQEEEGTNDYDMAFFRSSMKEQDVFAIFNSTAFGSQDYTDTESKRNSMKSLSSQKSFGSPSLDDNFSVL